MILFIIIDHLIYLIEKHILNILNFFKGTGWWKFEVCYGKHVMQYHEVKTLNYKKKRRSLSVTITRNLQNIARKIKHI